MTKISAPLYFVIYAKSRPSVLESKRCLGGVSIFGCPSTDEHWGSFFSALLIFMFSFLLREINLTVNITGFQQFLVSARCGNPAVIQHHNLIGMLHRADALGNDDFRGVGNISSESALNRCIAARIHRAG